MGVHGEVAFHDTDHHASGGTRMGAGRFGVVTVVLAPDDRMPGRLPEPSAGVLAEHRDHAPVLGVTTELLRRLLHEDLRRRAGACR
jgi:hypothetical protein